MAFPVNEIQIAFAVNVYIVTDLLKAFLGDGSVNMIQRATVEDVSQWTNVIARCWATVSERMNSLANNHVTCVFCAVREEPI
jgi:hypothetical protein